MSKGILFVMSGPSGTGKGTVCSELIKREDIYLSISCTTREVRKGEIEDVTYHYVTREKFREMIDGGEMLEWAQYGENLYGTNRSYVDEALNKGQNVLLEIEPQGALKVKAAMNDAVLLFIVPPSMAELKKRLTERGRESAEEIQTRMKAAEWEFSQAKKYNHVIINDDLEECVKEVMSIMRKTEKEREMIETLLNEKY